MIHVQNFHYRIVPWKKNVINSGANKSSSVDVDNKGRDILILGEWPTKGLDDTTLAAEAKYPITFT